MKERGGAWRLVGLARVARVGAWRRVECVLVRQKIQAARGGACDVFSGRSWLGFSWDCLFYHLMPLLLQLDEQNDEIRELLGLWA